jgi:hypothetical protein
MSRLQIRLFGPYVSSFSAHSYNYEPSNELKSSQTSKFSLRPVLSDRLLENKIVCTVFSVAVFLWSSCFKREIRASGGIVEFPVDFANNQSEDEQFLAEAICWINLSR